MLQLHRAERADLLVAALAEILAVPPDDPFAPDMVAVHARGIERWLQQELSLRLGVGADGPDGVAANIMFPFPARVVNRALAAASDIDPEDDPWRPSRVVWPLLEVLDDVAAEPWLEPLRWHVAGDGADDPLRRGRRYPAARHIANLFDRYGVHRPDMIRAWHDGRDVDGSAHPLEPSDGWQPKLWRRLRTRLDVPSPAERLVAAVARLRDGQIDEDKLDLPRRLSLFGLTALPASYLAVLTALANHRDIHLFLLHPSAALWDDVAALLRREGTVPRRRDGDATRHAPRNPLLASWGRDAREVQLVLAATGEHGDHRPPAAAPGTLLGHIQRDVWANRPVHSPPSGGSDPRDVLTDNDRSLQVHACHGRTRQVEVLRDAVLHLLADDPTLEPRDILIMCPDIETFAPLISAVFGAAAVSQDGEDESGGRDLRVKLADRAIRQTNPILRVIAEVLALADGRVSASEVLGLAGREPVRRQFRFDDDALEQLERWVAAARIRWGIDADHRVAFGLGDVANNTWRAGLDRILLGVAMPDEGDRLVEGTVPLDDVPEPTLITAGRLAELIDRLEVVFDSFGSAQTVTEWRTAILTAADLLTATTERDTWQRAQLERILADVVDEATIAGATSVVPLALAEVRALLEDRLRGRPTKASHRTGDLTVCTLVPMRSVPHRVIGLLGMDDGSFPRRTSGDGDDLIDRDPHVGDRDPRTEDRQLLLDALLAARDALVVTYTGRDVRTNELRPPAVPIGELLDVVDRTVRLPDAATPARSQVVVEHPLQPFDPRNFAERALGTRDRWSFNDTALGGARALAEERHPLAPFLSPPLQRLSDEQIPLDELVRFFEHPVKAFLRRRLDIYVSESSDEPSDSMPVELDSLETYAVGDRLLSARLDGTDTNRWATAERARGTLPPGRLADVAIDGIVETVDAILAAAAGHLDPHGSRHAVDVDLRLADGRRVVGVVPNVIDGTLLTLQYSRVKSKQRMAAWVRLVAATAMEPDRPLSGLVAGRCSKSGKKTLATTAVTQPLGTTPAERTAHATAVLEELVAIYDQGLCEPLPLFCNTSAAWATATHRGKDAEGAARDAWSTTFKWANEDLDPEHVLVHGGAAAFEDIYDKRFCELATRLWQPLLDREEVEDC